MLIDKLATMTYLLAFVALFLCAQADLAIDPNTLRDVFGSSIEYSPSVPVPRLAQAPAVIPANETLVDPDYWDLDEFQPAATDYDQFDWTLTKRVAGITQENVLLSPLGLKLALAILTEAATGATQTELKSVLGFDLDRNKVRRKFATIIESLKKESPEYIMTLSSRIFVGNHASPRQAFAAIAQEFYKTELKPIDFNDASNAVQEINSWVSNTTQGRIPTLVNEDDVNGLVVLVLNTLFFKGSWRHQFSPNATKDDVFYVTPDIHKKVPFMQIRDQFYFTESNRYNAKILRMPYRGNKFAMYIIVPNTLTGLPHVLSGLSELRAEMNRLTEHLVDVILPKFKFEYTSRLDGILKDLGVRTAFQDTASFPGIARGQSLYQRLRVSKVLQRSGIEVNEVGSIAYTVTEIGIVNKFGEDSDEIPQEIIANKPFLFFIQDEVTQQLLFTGRVSDPSLKDGAFKAK